MALAISLLKLNIALRHNEKRTSKDVSVGVMLLRLHFSKEEIW